MHYFFNFLCFCDLSKFLNFKSRYKAFGTKKQSFIGCKPTNFLPVIDFILAKKYYHATFIFFMMFYKNEAFVFNYSKSRTASSQKKSIQLFTNYAKETCIVIKILIFVAVVLVPFNFLM